ncbi:MAG: hypothetical protein LBD50_02685 [Rickettsiales bacterium]|jgi:hypothetical protein|nr:hypothetical protein [Rickettsiales bacterium]
MGTFIKTQNYFSAGEISKEFFSRGDINGLSRLENMDVLSSGAISRRAGLRGLAEIPDGARLMSFSAGENENYLLVATDGHVRVFDGLEIIQNLSSPWGGEDLKKLQYAQRFGQMIFVHPDYPPYILKKNVGMFELSEYGFSSNGDMTVNIPFMKFDDSADIRISVSSNAGGNNYATFTASKNFWTPDCIGGRLLLLGQQWVIQQYVGPMVITASTNGSYTIPSAPVSDWSEAAFSARRGWPCSISFHQNRLVFGGSRSWAGGIWMSKVGVHNNFDVGTGLDDEAIFITLLSQRRQQICTLVSGDNLQILASAGEWAVSSNPLTPSSVSIRQHTDVGSMTGRYLPPQKMEGGTVFISASGKDIRELSLDELGENYNAADLCALSKHLMNNPVDLAYNDRTNQLFVVMEDGVAAVLNRHSALGISAWCVYKTQGSFKSVAVMGGETFASVQRGEKTFIEKFDRAEMTDGAGFGFSYAAEGLPLLADKHAPARIRIRKLSARLLDTKSVFINGFRAPLPNEAYDQDSPGYSGDVSVNLLGAYEDAMQPLWKIEGSEPLPATILSIAANGWYSI